MSADIIGGALAVVVGLAWFALSLAKVAARADQAARPLPGALGSSGWPELDAWERHVRTTPGLEGIPSIEDIDCAMWELEMGGDVR